MGNTLLRFSLTVTSECEMHSGLVVMDVWKRQRVRTEWLQAGPGPKRGYPIPQDHSRRRGCLESGLGRGRLTDLSHQHSYLSHHHWRGVAFGAGVRSWNEELNMHSNMRCGHCTSCWTTSPLSLIHHLKHFLSILASALCSKEESKEWDGP